MEITNEVKAKVFAQYLGSEITAPNPFDDSPAGMAKGNLTGIHGEYEAEIQFVFGHHAEEQPHYEYYDQCKLILRPLNEITDEEILQIVSIFLHKDKSECSVRIERVEGFYIAYYKEQVVENEQYHAIAMHLTINCSTYEIRNTWDYKYKNGTAGATQPLQEADQIWQYVRSIGIDTKQYLLGGKTLHECGLAIYETKAK